MAFTAARCTLAQEIEGGDRLVLYVGRGAYHNPKRDESQVVGMPTVRSGLKDCTSSVQIGERQFFCTCPLTLDAVLPERQGLPIRPLVPRLSFIKRPEVWGQYVRSSLVPLGS